MPKPTGIHTASPPLRAYRMTVVWQSLFVDYFTTAEWGSNNYIHPKDEKTRLWNGLKNMQLNKSIYLFLFFPSFFHFLIECLWCTTYCSRIENIAHALRVAYLIFKFACTSRVLCVVWQSYGFWSSCHTACEVDSVASPIPPWLRWDCGEMRWMETLRTSGMEPSRDAGMQTVRDRCHLATILRCCLQPE